MEFDLSVSKEAENNIIRMNEFEVIISSNLSIYLVGGK